MTMKAWLSVEPVELEPKLLPSTTAKKQNKKHFTMKSIKTKIQPCPNVVCVISGCIWSDPDVFTSPDWTSVWWILRTGSRAPWSPDRLPAGQDSTSTAGTGACSWPPPPEDEQRVTGWERRWLVDGQYFGLNSCTILLLKVIEITTQILIKRKILDWCFDSVALSLAGWMTPFRKWHTWNC